MQPCVACQARKPRSTKHGAGGRTRTGTMLPSQDFESCASTNSATPACISIHCKCTPKADNRQSNITLFLTFYLILSTQPINKSGSLTRIIKPPALAPCMHLKKTLKNAIFMLSNCHMTITKNALGILS